MTILIYMSRIHLRTITHHVHKCGIVHNMLVGAGLAHAIHSGSFLHIPIVFMFPITYAGYQTYENKEDIAIFVRKVT